MELRPYQNAARDAILEQWNDGIGRTLLILPTGCHAKDHPILMYDGAVRMVQDIIPGDVIMGADATPRHVLALARGRETMYRVTPIKGEPFVVNASHILSLVCTNEGKGKYPSQKTGGEIDNITVREYLTKSKSWQHLRKLYRSASINKFDGNDGLAVTVDPYFLGVLLGDGDLVNSMSVTTMEPEIKIELARQCQKYGMTVKTKPAGKATTYTFISNQTGCIGGTLHQELKALGVRRCGSGKKFVPEYYKTLPIRERLEVVAGLLDTDGCITGRNGYDFISKSKMLAEDLVFMCRSAGLAAYVSFCQKSCGEFTGEYFRVSISGDCDRIPCRVERRKSTSRMQKKNVLRTGFTIEKLPEDNFYGFALDGDHLYLDGSFTVHHNTGKTIVFAKVIEERVRRGGNVLVLAHREELLQQASDKLATATGLMTALEKAESSSVDSWFNVTVGSVQTLQNAKRLERFSPDHFDTIVVDEAHHAVSSSYRRVLDYFKDARVLGVTATADRGDKRNLGEVFETIAYEYTLVKAIREGYLSPIKALTLPLSIDLAGVKVQSGDFQAAALGSALDPYLDQIAGLMAEHCRNRKTVVFLPLVATSQKMRDLLIAHGMTAAEVNGESKDRAEVLADFHAGRYQVLCNSMLLCLDMETEILTSRGFVGADDIKEEDLVANWNFDGSVFFEKPHEIVRRPLGLNEHMVSIDSRTINLRVTNTHRMIVSYGENRENWKKVPASELRNGHLLPASGIAAPLDVEMPKPPYERLTHIRVESGELAYTRPAGLTLDECRFIGFFLAEGTRTELNSGGIEYKACQVRDKYPEIVKWFDNVISKCGFDVVRHERFRDEMGMVVYWSFSRGTGHSAQKRNGLFKIEPYLDHEGSNLLWGLDEEQFDALVDGFWRGDGFHGEAFGSMPSSIQMRGCYHGLFDKMSAIGAVRGWRCNLMERPQKNPQHNTQWELRMIKRRPLNISCKTVITQEPPSEEQVWCVRTTSKNIITRRHGKTCVMGNTEGWDEPAVDCIVCLRPTKVRALYAQIVGRGTRLAPGKKELLLLDFLWQTEKHDLCRPAHLICQNDDISARVAEIMAETSQEDGGGDLLELEGMAEGTAVEEREESLRKELEAQRMRKRQLVDPLQFEMSISPGGKVAEYEPDPFNLKEQAPPSAAQLAKLEKAGIFPDEVKCAGHASRLIDTIEKRRAEGLATAKQIRCLERYGFRGVGTWEFTAASNLITRIAANRWSIPHGVVPATYVPAVPPTGGMV